MSEFTCEIPETETPQSQSIGLPLLGMDIVRIPELEFPRKLEKCQVVIWCGSYKREDLSTDDYEIWLLSPSSIKISDGERIWEKHNVAIEFTYLKQE